MESKAVMNQEFVKLDRFDGTNFTCWKDKMMFLLLALKISYILNPALVDLSPPNPDEDEQTKKIGANMKKMNCYAEDIFSTICLIVYMIFLLLLRLQRRYGVHWNSNTTTRNKVWRNFLL